MDFKAIDFHVAPPIAWIRHNRPDKSNAQDKQLLDELDRALDLAVQDQDVKVIVIGAQGRHFSAGHDVVSAAKDRPALGVEERWYHEERLYYDQSLKVYDCPKPTIAAVQGACIAGGFMLANVCDLIVASDDAFFSDPVGHTLGAAGVELLLHPWVMGARHAKEMLFTGRRFNADEALRLGMVNKVVPRDALDHEVDALGQRIAQAPEFALRLIKRSINRSLDIQGFRTSLAAHFDTHQLSHASESFQALTGKDRRQVIAGAKSLAGKKGDVA